MASLKNIIIIFIPILLAGCEENYQTENISRNVVIEGYLSPGDSIGIKVSRILNYSSNDSVAETLDTCSIAIYIKDKKYQMTSAGNGNYYVEDSTLTITEGDTIGLAFDFNGYKITSSTQIPLKPVNFTASATTVSMPSFSRTPGQGSFTRPEPIKFSWDNTDSSFYLVAIKPIDPNAVPTRPEDTINDFRPVRIFRNQPVVSSSYDLEVMQLSYYGLQYVILYHLNPEYAALYKFSGNTSLNITEPSSNIENGLGIFTGMNTDTIIINVLKSK